MNSEPLRVGFDTSATGKLHVGAQRARLLFCQLIVWVFNAAVFVKRPLLSASEKSFLCQLTFTAPL